MSDLWIDRSIRAGQTIRAVALIREQHGCDLDQAVVIFQERAAELGRVMPVPEERPADFELTTASPANNYAILTRLGGWFVQGACGPASGAAASGYALERQTGGIDHHYRVEVCDIEQIRWAFTAFLDDDPTLITRFAWQPYTI
jgi:hypothetical protein